MKTCRACRTNNADDAHLCTGCGAPLTEMAAEAEVQRMLRMQEQAKKRRRLRNLAVVAVAIAGAGALVVRSNQKKAQQEAVAQFALAAGQAHAGNVVEFWKCVTRGAVSPVNNLQLTDSIEAAFRKAPKGYLMHVRDRCLPLAIKAPQEIRAVKAPETVKPRMEAYALALEGVKTAAMDFVDELKRMADAAQLDARVIDLAANYHAAEHDGPNTYAYDHFLRCAVPGYDDMADPQVMLEFFAAVLKDTRPGQPSGHVTRWRTECEPPLADTALAKPHEKYKFKLEKFTPDTRDVSAFTDIFKRADEAQRKKLLEPMEKAWFESAQSWEQLKSDIKDVLGEAKE